MSLHRRSKSGTHSAGRSSYELADLPQLQSSHSINDGKIEEDSQAIVNTYNRLNQRITDFDHQLDVFVSECRKVMEPKASILAARNVRKGLEDLLSMFHMNASHLAPHLPERAITLSPNAINEPFDFWLQALAEACATFSAKCIFYMEGSGRVRFLMMRFSDHLMYRASCLRMYKDSLHTDYIRNHINDLADQLGNDFDDLVSAFVSFNQTGAMQYKKKQKTKDLLTLLTVSTFFSGVTATMLQISVSLQGNDQVSASSIRDANTSWLWALTFSISAVLESLIGVFEDYVPRGCRIFRFGHGWVPPYLLAFSILYFITGLFFFVPACKQEHGSIVVMASPFGLAVLRIFADVLTLIFPRLLRFPKRSPTAATSVSAGAMPISSTPTDDDIQFQTPFLSIPDQPFSTIPIPAGNIRDLEYSPDGTCFAITRYDKEKGSSVTEIYTASAHDQLALKFHIHSLQQVCKHLSWSTNSQRLLTRFKHRIDFLDKDCQFIHSVRRALKVESATWIPSSDTEFLLVERSVVLKMSIQGHVLVEHRFDHFLLRDVAVVPDSTLLLVIGRVMCLPDVSLPKDVEAERQIILYDKQNQIILSHHPLPDDIRYLRIAREDTKARHGFDVLLCHRSGVLQPSCLWTLQCQASGRPQLSPRTIDLRPVADINRHRHFIGESDQMIAGVDSSGNIHIWDRETALQVCYIPAHATEKHFRCFTWSTRAAIFVSIDDKERKLKIWSISKPALVWLGQGRPVKRSNIK